MILTIDLGTSVTKAAVWNDSGVVGAGRAPLETVHRHGGRAEQEPANWWRSVVDACAELGHTTTVDAVVFAAARQTFVPVTAQGDPLGAALLWSDRRASAEAAEIAESCADAEALRARTGAVLDGASVAAKVAWLARHEPDRLDSAAWILSPRDLIVRTLTGVVATDVTLASVTGLYDADGHLVPELVGAATGKLPAVVQPGTIIGTVQSEQARALGVRPGVPVVIGAGDRACEVLGTGATQERPMVAWGTTANVSVPVSRRPDPVPRALSVTRGAHDEWLLEGGLSAAGSLLEWVAGLTGSSVKDVANGAAARPPGSGGLVAFPWLGGARAPWWRDDARAGFVGLGFEHAPADLARAVMEAVAFDVARCLEAMRDAGADPQRLVVGGSSGTGPAWSQVLTGVTGLPAERRRSGEAAMAGAALIGSATLGAAFDLDRLDPVVAETTPPPDVVARYAELRPVADRIAAAALEMTARLA